jgi:peptidyl-prolyl cis-trans isomerase A (cyclophilin A)
MKTNPVVVMTTSMGDIEIELFEDKAPVTVKNFLQYADDGFYDNTIFHRVIKGFMVQGGGFTKDMQQKTTRAPIRNEADNGLRNLRGTLSMARTSVVDSATSQFFMNLVDNAFLDHGSRDFGYAVFAKITDGLDVLDLIGTVPTTSRMGHRDVPAEPVLINSIRRKASA